ncbi:hypothetical protein DPMN_056875 [Dreissena polymorpha]|uniref:Uncharacterized protein n=1 Tax=Dreissena polymorpha TaxID=45954 RepID=A0A9D4CU40_DREPO|nr:hypothetical protein DPMN_056875 [Dreissena polymorpha]
MPTCIEHYIERISIQPFNLLIQLHQVTLRQFLVKVPVVSLKATTRHHSRMQEVKSGEGHIKTEEGNAFYSSCGVRQ